MDRFFGKVCRDRATIRNDLNHLKVKRVKTGDLVEVLDEETFKPFLCQVEKISKKEAQLSVVKELEPNLPKVFVRLYQCVPVKLSTFDEIVENAVQVGVSQLIPVVSKRSFQKVSVIEEKLDRWRRVAAEALKQCGRHHPLEVLPPVRLEQIPPPSEGELRLFPFEREKSKLLKEELLREKPREVSLLIGPEGGFSEEEARLAREKGFKPVSLGNFVLKAETAATVAAFTAYHLLL
ncbi:MAG: 16S rRNA (uracil(1498)-N(3))-methyltransferase [Aquificae bacterium]|nr:16S rRNA (uracil(1498)-N(3))-methyltransferase [Aquificota bacterium]